ncbi:DNA cytosine methyltransferase [Terricaulis sp.]|uniref:DNA cytosine methyltransferase n=1 Tax=Terricaulis sp. TaxID=2768686 RepID=UPI0037842EFD
MKPKAISLFSGVGGLDFGFEASGFETRVALDLDPVACATIRRNRTWPVIEGDLATIESSTILKAGKLKRGEADVLFGGPPCQPFSKSGYWATGDAKRLTDPRAGTLKHFLRVLGETQPKTFLLENVPGLAFSGKNEGLQFIRRGIEHINTKTGANYSLHIGMLNAADFGVPQTRERVVMVGARDGQAFHFPSPTHAPRGQRLLDLPHYRTAWDALGDLPEPTDDPGLAMTGKWADLLATIPEGENYLWHTARGGGVPLFGWRTRFWNFMLKLAKDQPSWTIQAQCGPATGPFHWRNRKLSATELGRLQTLPDGLMFNCARGDIQRLIGNAVPSLLAEVLAREIKAQLLGARRSHASLKLLPPDRGTPPPPTRPAKLPAKYRAIAGVHTEHPGPGKGPGAKARSRRAA